MSIQVNFKVNMDDPIVKLLYKTLTFDEKELFIKQFYGYLEFDEEKDFIIDLDIVYKWLGFTRHDNAKRLLQKHFILDEEYKIHYMNLENITSISSNGNSLLQREEHLDGAGLNKEQVLLNVQTLKAMGMLAI